MDSLQGALTEAYQDLDPYSKKYNVDFRRYLYTLKTVTNLPDAKKKKFLDVGTGIGILPLALKKLGYDAKGLDLYVFPENGDDFFGIEEIEKVKSIWKKFGLKIINGDVYALNLEEITGTYDIITAEAIIEHQKDPKKFLSGLRAILKPGGYLLISTPNSTTLLQRARFLLGRSPNWPVDEFFESGESFTGHWREYTMKELIYMCSASKFDIVKASNKNLLTRFKGLKAWRKNIRASFVLLSTLVPGSREMNYVLCRKK